MSRDKSAIPSLPLPYAIPTSKGVVLPLGVSTAAAGLYQKDFLNLPFPTEDPESLDRTLLIWGGSSSVGSCCIQLAVASGAEVITTASPSNFYYCKKLGASVLSAQLTDQMPVYSVSPNIFS